ncbi:hypothetical protein SI65_07823 [Aspergillus cristatus]|uniref:HTH CENPB-type domain-containing protein n=1 Tax=Aspergillus cristatus TaxID=573508 RepID=A0A1E3B7K0_ASPCR|nr:hypothetical protein SI65_07823 [Aspergillus cristatus]
MDRRGAAPRPAHIQDMANILLSKRGDTSIKTVGVNWVYNFIKRQDDLKTNYSRRYNHQRAKCEDPKIIKEWFDQVQITIMQYGIAFEDIYNFDETGYAMGLIATAKVVTRAEMTGRPFLVQPGNREWVTSIECINSTGWALPPCIIFKGKVHIEGWYQDEALPKDWRIEVSDNGWTTDQIGLRWLQNTFIPATNGHMIGKYRLLILDGHGSHLTPQFDEICSQNDIIPICMPAHSSHLLQPLDVGCFAPLKMAYGCLVENRARQNFNHINKLDFLEAYPQARTEAFKAENIKNSFAAAGLVPFSPERVFEKLNVQLKTPTPPGSRSTDSAPKTPHNLKQLEKQASTIKKLLGQRTQSPPSPVNDAINRLVKGCEIHMNTAILLTKEVQDLRAAHEKKRQQKKRSKRQIAHTGGLSIQEGIDLMQQRNEAQETEDTIQMETVQSTFQPHNTLS